ncbi:MAG: hypothetical protein L6R42_010304 [Xanthoria sp. 1 TBL-2021]|nr:MAG: hypothetical protein L6R42_010304 [Xanthoria sp. 1 TBL-2021]
MKDLDGRLLLRPIIQLRKESPDGGFHYYIPMKTLDYVLQSHLTRITHDLGPRLLIEKNKLGPVKGTRTKATEDGSIVFKRDLPTMLRAAEKLEHAKIPDGGADFIAAPGYEIVEGSD